MAPSSFITNAAYFQAADELRRIQWTAYRAKSLALDHDAALASSAHTRHRWEEDAAWQRIREAVEKMLIAYDWGEAFVALHLTVKRIRSLLGVIDGDDRDQNEEDERRSAASTAGA